MRKTKNTIKNMNPILIKSDGSIIDTVEWKEDELPVKTFIERLASSFNTNVIIQRDANWPLNMKIDLIRSMMTGTPIGYCLLCERPQNVAKKNVIDFKNRALTIREFWSGDFAIRLRLEREDGSFEDQDMTWTEISESNDPQLQNLMESFENYKIKCLVYKNMDLFQQADKFNQVNTQLPMENEELLYGTRFWVKGFFRCVHDIVLKNLIRHTTSNQLSKNIKEKGTIFVHRVFYTCFGSKLDDVWAVRDLGNSKTTQSCKPLVAATSEFNNELNLLAKEHNDIADRLISGDISIIKESIYWKKIETVKKCCNSLNNVLNGRNKSGKNLLQNDMFDCIIFFMKKILEDRLTFAMMDEHPELYLDIITKYVESKKDNSNLRGQSVTKKKIEERMNLFETIWKDLSDDDGIKNQKPTATEISLAYLKSGSVCPIVGDSLDEDTRVEHNDPKSKSSETSFSIVSERGNRWKSNLSLEQNQKVVNYQKTIQFNESNAPTT